MILVEYVLEIIEHVNVLLDFGVHTIAVMSVLVDLKILVLEKVIVMMVTMELDIVIANTDINSQIVLHNALESIQKILQYALVMGIVQHWMFVSVLRINTLDSNAN